LYIPPAYIQIEKCTYHHAGWTWLDLPVILNCQAVIIMEDRSLILDEEVGGEETKEDPSQRHRTGSLTAHAAARSIRKFIEKKDDAHSITQQTVRRTTAAVTLFFFVYVLIGILVYDSIEGWGFTNAVYFTVNTFLSIGYGDMTITRGSEMMFTGFFVLCGAGFIGSAIGVVVANETSTRDEDLHKYRQTKEFHENGGEANFQVHKWERQYARKNLLLSFFVILLVVLVGTLVMGIFEDWTYVESFYWSTVTITTTGYGDYVPTTIALKWFTTFYSLIGVISLARAMSYIAQFPILARRIEAERRILKQFATSTNPQQVLGAIGFGAEFEELSIRKNPDSVERAEFILNMLLLLDKVTATDIRECNKQFDLLDVNGDGSLDREDFTAEMLRSRRRRSSSAEALALAARLSQRRSGSEPRREA